MKRIFCSLFGMLVGFGVMGCNTIRVDCSDPVSVESAKTKIYNMSLVAAGLAVAEGRLSDEEFSKVVDVLSKMRALLNLDLNNLVNLRKLTTDYVNNNFAEPRDRARLFLAIDLVFLEITKHYGAWPEGVSDPNINCFKVLTLAAIDGGIDGFKWPIYLRAIPRASSGG
jgi:hypothetical protein